MTIIIRQNLTISGNIHYSDDIQVASGVTVTVQAGATLDLGGHTILNYGNLTLAGSASKFSGFTNGKYSTSSTSGALNSTYGKIDGVNIDGFFSQGSLTLQSTVVQSSSIDALAYNSIADSLFKDSSFDLGIHSGTVVQSTFKNTLISEYAWTNQGSFNFSKSNFVADGQAIYLDPFFNGPGFSHGIRVADSYMHVPSGGSFEDKVNDWDDDLRINTDISASSFVDGPYVNSSSGFSVGSILLSWSDLGIVARRLTGTAGKDTLIGGLGADTLDGGADADSMAGGGGSDTYYVDNVGDVVNESSATATTGYTDTVISMLSAYVLGVNLENGLIQITGAARLTGNELNNVLTGNAAANVLDGRAGSDTLIGGAGNDVYVVDAVSDKVVETSTLANEIDTVQSSVNWVLLSRHQ